MIKSAGDESRNAFAQNRSNLAFCGWRGAERRVSVIVKPANSDKTADQSMNRTQSKSLGGALIVVALALGITGMVRVKQPVLYAATTLFKVERQPSDLPDLTGVSELATNTAAGLDQTIFIETEIALMQSDAILGKVIERLDLNRTWGQRFNAGQSLPPEATFQILKARLHVRSGAEPEQIAITASSDITDEAAQLANATATAYGEYRVDYRRRLTQTSLDLVAESYAAMEKQLAVAGEKVAAVRQRLDPSWPLPAAGSKPTVESEAMRALQAGYSKSVLRYLAQSNQVALFPAKHPDDDEVVAQLQAKAGLAREEMIAAETALRREVQKQALLLEYQTAVFELEDLNQRFAPLQKKVEELRTIQREQQQSSVEVIEPAAAPATPVVQRAASPRIFFVGSAAALALGLGLCITGRKPVVSPA